MVAQKLSTLSLWWQSLQIALSWFSRLPHRNRLHSWPPSAELQNASLAQLPLVAIAIALSSLLLYTPLLLLGVEPLLAIVVLLASQSFAGGFLHEDGAADSADALLIAHERERAFTIMREPQIGVFAAITLIFIYAFRFTLLYTLFKLLPAAPFAAVVVAALTLSRFAALDQIATLPAAERQAGRSRGFDRITLGALLYALAICAAVLVTAATLTTPTLALLLLVPLAISRLIAPLLLRRLGGHSGDTLGLTIVAAELATLFAATIALGLPPLALHGQ